MIMVEMCPNDGSKGVIWSTTITITGGQQVYRYSFNKCSQCELYFGIQLNSLEGQPVPKSVHELDDSSVVGNHDFQCPSCQNTTFTNYETTTLYIKNYNANNSPDIYESKPQKKILEKVKSVEFKFYLCDTCGASFCVEFPLR